MSYSSFYNHRFSQLLRQVRKLKKNNPPKFYAVAVGRRIGIYRTWPSTKVQIDGIANAKYRRFDDHEQALQYLTEHPKETPVPVQLLKRLSGAVTREEAVYVDGSCWRNGLDGARGGIGVYWPAFPEHNTSTLLTGKQTNVRAELQAAISALRQAKSLGVQSLIIFTDSHFVIQCATSWIPLWKANGWKTASLGSDVKNRPDLEELEDAINALEKVTWLAVPGHSGVEGNEAADKLANEAIANYYRENGIETPAEGKAKRKKAAQRAQVVSAESTTVEETP